MSVPDGGREPERTPGRRRCTVTLRALEGAPLADDAVRAMVVANAHAIAERQGVSVHDIQTTDEAITVVLDDVPEGARVIAMGFAAELRRSTTNWYTRKYDVATLWGDPPGVDDGETWKDGQEPWTPE